MMTQKKVETYIRFKQRYIITV